MSADPRRLTRDEARRIAIRAQLLDADRPPDLVVVVDRLMFLQLDPTAVVAPSADLVAWTRLGDAYRPAHLQQALEVDHSMFEHRAQPVDTEPVIAMVHAIADLGLYLADMTALRSRAGRVHDWLVANDAFRQRVLDRLADSGPLASQDIPDTAVVPWASSGWTNDRNVTQMLEFLASRGYIAVAGRRGRQRLWDLAEQVYPADTPVVPAEEARRIRAERRLRSLGIARPKVVEEAGLPAEVEGTSGPWRVDPEATAEGFTGRTALLSPFDRLTHDRVRAGELFDFEYLLEMYKPAAHRRWGYFALPVLHGDRLIGKVDSGTDRKASVLDVRAVHEDIPFTAAMTESVEGELAALAHWLGLTRVKYA
ncbi:MAG TPA: crosslink repair DNA glycosylase YcaQ family protein [Patescibacteria group bacterium]|nr:crosslink repair DNA glycosylase YcaQ family protein [Patescibacteria group bacterium]